MLISFKKVGGLTKKPKKELRRHAGVIVICWHVTVFSDKFLFSMLNIISGVLLSLVIVFSKIVFSCISAIKAETSLLPDFLDISA